jgi:hypothetical protein
VKTAIEVIKAGYNAIVQDGETFRIVGGTGALILLQHHISNEKSSIEVDKVQTFATM